MRMMLLLLQSSNKDCAELEDIAGQLSACVVHGWSAEGVPKNGPARFSFRKYSDFG